MVVAATECVKRTPPPAPESVTQRQHPTPTLQDVFRARRVVDRYLARTPLINPPALSARLGCDLFLKCENLQPIGAFKVRGGINLLSHLSPDERARGVITASTGNHGQSIAYAAREFGARAIIYVPEGANPIKVAAIERLSAEVVFHGNDFDECRAEAEARAARDGAYFVHHANEPRLIAGVATYALEILEAAPDLDVLIVPAGGGSGVSGSLIAGKAINPSLRVVAVQATGAPVLHDSWRQRRVLAYDHMDTFAEGLATRVAFELPMRVLWDYLDDFRLVSDAEIRRAILVILETAGMLAEGAGAAAIAAAYQMRDELAGKKVAAVVSGGNLTMDALQCALDEEQPW
ncbi:MAG: threonine ammonia-lyase [Thermomicrobiales bacterium]